MMSDLKKIKDEILLKLKRKLNLSEINEIKSNLFGKNGIISYNLKKLEVLPRQRGKNLLLISILSRMNYKI